MAKKINIEIHDEDIELFVASTLDSIWDSLGLSYDEDIEDILPGFGGEVEREARRKLLKSVASQLLGNYEKKYQGEILN